MAEEVEDLVGKLHEISLRHSVCGTAPARHAHTGQVHWILLSTLGRVLTVVAAVAILAVILQTLAQAFSSLLIFVAIVAVVAALVVRRRDLNRAIARQLQRDADDEVHGRDVD